MFEKKKFFRKVLTRIQKLPIEESKDMIEDLVQEHEALLNLLNELSTGVIILSEHNDIKYLNEQAAKTLRISTNHALSQKISSVVSDPGLSRWLEVNLAHFKTRICHDLPLIEPSETILKVTLLDAKNQKDKILFLENASPRTLAMLEKAKLQHRQNLLQLAGGLAHEIGNPLGSIAIHLSLLKDKVSQLPQASRNFFNETLSIISNETNRLDRIVKSFLKISRRGALRFKLENLNEILEEAIHFIQPECSAQNIKVSFRQDSSLESFLMDRERLYSCFLNLLKNAIEAMPDGGKLSIEAKKISHMALIQIRDTGVGIEEKNLPRIFNPYFTTKEEGSGLGLMFVYNAIEDHQGRVEVNSRPDEGTTFFIYLPIRKTKLQLPSTETAA